MTFESTVRCAQDTDGDGLTDLLEGESVDSDGDGLFDYQESWILDSDGDTVVDQDDFDNADSCVPDPTFCAPPDPAMLPLHQGVLSSVLFAAGIARLRSRA